VKLADGVTRPARVRVLRANGSPAALPSRPETTVVEMVLTEGRNRQIRRMWAALGQRVKRLLRVAIGAYQLGDLPAGDWRELKEADIGRLTKAGRGVNAPLSRRG
jgi:pseudouridine synthase